MRYSFSSSMMSTSGAHSATAVLPNRGAPKQRRQAVLQLIQFFERIPSCQRGHGDPPFLAYVAQRRRDLPRRGCETLLIVSSRVPGMTLSVGLAPFQSLTEVVVRG